MVERSVPQHKLEISTRTLKMEMPKCWDFFFESKSDKELLGVGKIPRDLIYFGNIPYSKYKKYLEVGRFVDPKVCIEYRHDDWEFYQSYFELFPKLVWLLDDFTADTTFKNPVGFLFNPLLDQYEIHPGGSRKLILELTDEKFFNGLIFNTDGKGIKEEEFSVVFKNKSSIFKYYEDKDLAIGLTPHNGTLIPHIHFDMRDIEDKSIEYSVRVNNFLDSTYLEASFLDYWNITNNIPSKPNKVEIKLSKNLIQNRSAQLVGIALACLGRDVVFNGIKVVHTRK